MTSTIRSAAAVALSVVAAATTLVATAAPAEARPTVRFTAQGDRIVMTAAGLPRRHVDCDMTRTFEGPVQNILGSLSTGYNHKMYRASGRGPVVRIRSESLAGRTSYPVSGGCIDQQSRIIVQGKARVFIR